MKRPSGFQTNPRAGGVHRKARTDEGPCVSTAIHSRSTPFRIGLITRCDVLNADEIERFHAFAYKCAWVVIEGENVTGYVIT